MMQEKFSEIEHYRDSFTHFETANSFLMTLAAEMKPKDNRVSVN
jgi:hypothetical protein